MKLLAVVLNRIFWIFPTLAGLIAITFFISRSIPADPAALVAGEAATAEQIDALRTKLGFDRSQAEQFKSYVVDLIHGNLGKSFYTGRAISVDLSRRIYATMELTIVAMLISTLVGIPLGVVSAIKRNSTLDHGLRILTVAGLAVASFWLGMMLQLFFSMELGWTPLNGRMRGFAPSGGTGFYLVDSVAALDLERFLEVVAHLALPALTLAIPALATVVRFTRAGVLEVVQSGYVFYERAMGIPQAVITWKYILRNALISTVTQIGLLFGALLAGAVVIETIFDWPGIGDYAYNSILQSDYNAIMGFTIWAGVIFIVANLIVDLAHAVIDPRRRT